MLTRALRLDKKNMIDRNKGCEETFFWTFQKRVMSWPQTSPLKSGSNFRSILNLDYECMRELNTKSLIALEWNTNKDSNQEKPKFILDVKLIHVFNHNDSMELLQHELNTSRCLNDVKDLPCLPDCYECC